MREIGVTFRLQSSTLNGFFVFISSGLLGGFFLPRTQTDRHTWHARCGDVIVVMNYFLQL